MRGQHSTLASAPTPTEYADASARDAFRQSVRTLDGRTLLTLAVDSPEPFERRVAACEIERRKDAHAERPIPAFAKSPRPRGAWVEEI